MSTAPTEQDDRRIRWRFVLLWVVSVVVVAAFFSVGFLALTGDGSGSSTAERSVDAAGTGTAPVLESPPVDFDPPDEPQPTRTASGSDPTPRSVATRNAGGGDATVPTPRSTSTAALGPPRTHGVSLALTSTLSESLRPGFERALYISVRNPNPFPVDLYRVDVRVDDSPKPGCLSDWVETGHYRYGGGTPRRVEASGTIVVNLPILLVNLVDVDQNACQNTFFPLRLSGLAVDSQ